MPRFTYRPSGAAVYSDDEDALDYMERNASSDTIIRLRCLHVVYDLALCKIGGMTEKPLEMQLLQVCVQQSSCGRRPCRCG